MKKLTDPTKLNKIGWNHAVELDEGIRKIYGWYTSQISLDIPKQ